MPTSNPDLKKSFRGPDGKVKTLPPNISTSINIIHHPGEKNNIFGHLFSKPAPHMKEEFDRRRELEFKNHVEGKKKMKESFKTGYQGSNPFWTDKKTYNREGLPPLEPKTMRRVETEKKFHDAPFKPSSPSKKGLAGFMNPFPEYISDPIRIPVRKHDDGKRKDAFKPVNTAEFIRPTPSISLNKKNLKTDMLRLSSTLL